MLRTRRVFETRFLGLAANRDVKGAPEVNALVGELLKDGMIGLLLELLGEGRSLGQAVEVDDLLVLTSGLASSLASDHGLGGEADHVSFNDVLSTELLAGVARLDALTRLLLGRAAADSSDGNLNLAFGNLGLSNLVDADLGGLLDADLLLLVVLATGITLGATDLALGTGLLLAVLASHGVGSDEVLRLLEDALARTLEFLVGLVIVVTANTAGLALVLVANHNLNVLTVEEDLEVIIGVLDNGNGVDSIGLGLTEIDADKVVGLVEGDWLVGGEFVDVSVDLNLHEILLLGWHHDDLLASGKDGDLLGVGLVFKLGGVDGEALLRRAVHGDKDLALGLGKLVGDVVEGADSLLHEHALGSVLVTGKQVHVDLVVREEGGSGTEEGSEDLLELDVLGGLLDQKVDHGDIGNLGRVLGNNAELLLRVGSIEVNIDMFVKSSLKSEIELAGDVLDFTGNVLVLDVEGKLVEVGLLDDSALAGVRGRHAIGTVFLALVVEPILDGVHVGTILNGEVLGLPDLIFGLLKLTGDEDSSFGVALGSPSEFSLDLSLGFLLGGLIEVEFSGQLGESNDSVGAEEGGDLHVDTNGGLDVTVSLDPHGAGVEGVHEHDVDGHVRGTGSTGGKSDGNIVGDEVGNDVLLLVLLGDLLGVGDRLGRGGRAGRRVVGRGRVRVIGLGILRRGRAGRRGRRAGRAAVLILIPGPLPGRASLADKVKGDLLDVVLVDGLASDQFHDVFVIEDGILKREALVGLRRGRRRGILLGRGRLRAGLGRRGRLLGRGAGRGR